MKDNLDKAMEALFAILNNKETDPETRVWARQEISQLLKIKLNPPIVFADSVFREYKP